MIKIYETITQHLSGFDKSSIDAAINKFKNSLNRTGVSRKTKKQDNTSTESMWNSFARRLRAD